jgi:hypothetical protein
VSSVTLPLLSQPLPRVITKYSWKEDIKKRLVVGS